jgi:uncharacterized protein YacL
MYSRKAVYTVRFFFLLVCAGVGALIAGGLEWHLYGGASIGAFFASVFIAVDILARNWSFRNFSSGTFGLMVGLFCAWLITRIDLGTIPIFSESNPFGTELRGVLELGLYLALGFLGSSLALRSNREEFSFIIPYVRFRREAIEEQPTMLDSNILIDGRILKLVKTGFLRGPFVVPRFVLDELQILADAPAGQKKDRGKRGLLNVQELRRKLNVEVSVHDDYEDNDSLPVDTRLVQLCRRLAARLLTNDANLGQVARLQGVHTLNLNDLSEAMRPEVLVGDILEIGLVRRGKDDHQAVGFLPDGTMVVVNHAFTIIGTTRKIVVSSAIQTSTGRIVFGELAEPANVGG